MSMAHIIHDEERKTFRFQFVDWRRKRRTVTGFRYTNASERKSAETRTLKLAAKTEFEHDEIRRGLRPEPKTWNKHLARSYGEVVSEYVAWGRSCGGRKGRPWGETHARNVKACLDAWVGFLGFNVLSDVLECLPEVEKVIRSILAEGKAPKTAWLYGEGLRAFCAWCADRDYLPEHPLAKLRKPNTDPKTARRALTFEEVGLLLNVAPEERALLYEVAINSGLRANELRSLTLSHLDADNCGLHLEPAWTKNRKRAFQPLPEDLVHRLEDFADSGRAQALYSRYARAGGRTGRPPADPLLFVPVHAERSLAGDLEKAGIDPETDEGKVVFHSLRNCFVTLLQELGASEVEARDMARHGSTEMTRRYSMSRKPRHHELADALGLAIQRAREPQRSVRFAERKAAGAEASPNLNTGSYLEPVDVVAGAGFAPAAFGL